MENGAIAIKTITTTTTVKEGGVYGSGNALNKGSTIVRTGGWRVGRSNKQTVVGYCDSRNKTYICVYYYILFEMLCLWSVSYYSYSPNANNEASIACVHR